LTHCSSFFDTTIIYPSHYMRVFIKNPPLLADILKI
jgi:hypothetical protein